MHPGSVWQCSRNTFYKAVGFAYTVYYSSCSLLTCCYAWKTVLICTGGVRLISDVDILSVIFPFPNPFSKLEVCKEWIKACGQPHEQLYPGKITRHYLYYVFSKVVKNFIVKRNTNFMLMMTQKPPSCLTNCISLQRQSYRPTTAHGWCVSTLHTSTPRTDKLVCTRQHGTDSGVGLVVRWWCMYLCM